MKILIIILCTTFAFPSVEDLDTIYLRDGNVIEGEIIDSVPNRYYKIKSGRSIFVFQHHEVKRIEKSSDIIQEIPEIHDISETPEISKVETSIFPDYDEGFSKIKYFPKGAISIGGSVAYDVMEYDYTEQSNERFYLNLSCQPFIAKNISFGPGFSYNRNISKYPGQKDYWNEYITLSLLTNFYFLNMFYVSPDLSILIYDNSEFEGPEESNTKYLKLSFGKVTQISSNVFLDYGVSFTDRKYKFTNEDGIDVENNSTQKSFYTGLKIIIPSKKK